MSRRAAIIVLDGLGIGPAADTDAYGDGGSNTLGNMARAVGGLALPNLEALGLGCCAPLAGVEPVERSRAAYGIAEPTSAGKDSITGHWELCGLVLDAPFPTYPHGFPAEVIEEFVRRTGRGVLGNLPASGTRVLEEFGEEHRRTGRWIVYTSNESGRDEIYVVPFLGTGGKWQVTTTGGHSSRWSPDGAHLDYLTADNTLTEVDVQTASTFAITATRPPPRRRPRMNTASVPTATRAASTAWRTGTDTPRRVSAVVSQYIAGGLLSQTSR